MNPTTSVSHSRVYARQLTLFRLIFGLYLTLHFIQLLPDAAELFSREGVLPDPSLNFSHALIPWNPLAIWDTPEVILWCVAGCVVGSVLLLIGWRREWVAFVLWTAWACLFHRNNLISNPSIPYVGSLLLLLTILPPGEPLRLDGKKSKGEWQLPTWVPFTAWTLLATGYSFSGWAKLASPSWIDGSALLHLLHNPLARPGFMRDLMLALPEWSLMGMTWAVLGLELAFLPLCLFRTSRTIAWSLILGMHLGIILVIDFADLSFGMVMIHLFTFPKELRDWICRWDQPQRFLRSDRGPCRLVQRLLRGWTQSMWGGQDPGQYPSASDPQQGAASDTA